MDGNQAAAYIAYALTEVAAIYPITPSSSMSEYIDEWASQGKKNIFGQTVRLIEMQSEAGAAGTVHGSLQAGALTTTFTASQGLLLKIPNMFKISGELLPGVIHVASRSISTHALSIFCDHQDIYSARMTGFAILSSNNVQAVMDLAPIAHLSAIKGRVPFLHFFDGFRTSHEIQKIEEIDYKDIEKLIDKKALKKFRDNALNPEHPVTRGTSQTEDIFFQVRESQNRFYDAIPDIVNSYMQKISKITKREYKPFTYYGDENATKIIIAMGSVTDTISQVVDYLNEQGEKVGLITVHLYRPFSSKYLFNVVPKTVKAIAVLDRTKEPGSSQPLYLDIRDAFYNSNLRPIIVGGRYGLSSKDTTPAQILSVFNNLSLKEPKNDFTIGIIDDVTYKSLAVASELDLSKNELECIFYGMGSDGTVSANKNTIKIIGDKTDNYIQGFFSYDSKKAGGLTRSYLRISKNQIKSPYLIQKPNFVACSTFSYLTKYDMLENMKDNGIFLLNTMYDKETIINKLPDNFKKQLAKKNIRLFIINATKLSYELKLGNRTNTILQSAFFKLTNIIDYKEAKNFMKEYALKTYSKKGMDIVEKNYNAIDAGDRIEEVIVDKNWENIETFFKEMKLSTFMQKISNPINSLKGYDIPVSAFVGHEDGTFEHGSAALEKRSIATMVPRWRPQECIQCNQCAFVCPHATIRPFLIDDEEYKNAPNILQTIKPIGKGMENLRYIIQVSPEDCTGCTACVDICPAKNKALVMVPIEEEIERKEDENARYLYEKVSYKDNYLPKTTVKGSQFAKPLFEFSGACAGCGETPYIKLLTQLYGERMIIANATGCSSIYGGSVPSTVYTTNSCGQGPAWSSSLFEDNAEYGYGLYEASETLRKKVISLMKDAINNDNIDLTLKEKFNLFIENEDENLKNEIVAYIEKLEDKEIILNKIYELRQYMLKKSVWIIGGDGWAYDIGYGGLDHVLSTGADVNVLVLDTEVYSNTGGQASKATPTAAIAKFSASGKRTTKKDLASLMMTYQNIYIARVAMGANQNQTIRAFKEAQEFKGPSLIIAYSPCIEHGIKGGLMSQTEEKLATEVGYWPLIRFNPDLIEKGKNPLQIDFKKPDWDKYEDFLMNENRFVRLKNEFPDEAERLLKLNKQSAMQIFNYYEKLASLDYSKE
ncbi:pyruvate:ferredoxin (flavodoxin) oxidoreductase [Caviibacter abscessus]|uniref:pyruvate:ferredoxin (flavodoxin) oxidoreductase n=1 Tax=Caviibacter abscessus TaxID=1766719 RepID=UPI000838C4FC|nr:pyruvate:ferredoxin (flavodoxin) oxidoreductase [Caviibacter abscessus]